MTRLPLTLDALSVVWIALGLLLLGVSLHPALEGDGIVRFHEITQLLAGEVPQGKYSIVQPLLSLPLYALGAAVSAPRPVVAYFNYVVFLVLVATLWCEQREGNERVRLIVLLMAGSMFPHHLQHYFGEVLTASACTIGLLLLERRPIVACILLAVGTANSPATIVGLVLALFFYLYRTRRPSVLLSIPLALTLIGGENLWRFGTLAPAPYLATVEHGVKTILPYSGRPGFSYPFWFGILSILLSFGKGLLFFVPGLLLRLRRCLPLPKAQALLTDTLLLFVAGLVLVYAKWWAWYGGVFWGPRFFLIACIPACILFARCLSQRIAVLPALLLVLSLWVCVQGYLYGLQAIEPCVRNDYALEVLCWYTPEFSPLWRQFVVGFSGVSAARVMYAGWCVSSVVCLLLQSWWHSGSMKGSAVASEQAGAER